jgi:hypothetical protein
MLMSPWRASSSVSTYVLHSVGLGGAAVDAGQRLAVGKAAPYHQDTGTFARRFTAFGWHTIEIDGHDMAAILDALQAAESNGPTAILARTEKGKGVRAIHGVPLAPKDGNLLPGRCTSQPRCFVVGGGENARAIRREAGAVHRLRVAT